MRLQCFAGIGTLLLCSVSAVGSLVVWRSLTTLSQEADLVVVGSASGGNVLSGVYSFNLHVIRVVKGDSSIVGGNLTVDWTSRSVESSVVSSHDTDAPKTGIWFLQRTAIGWALLPVMAGNVGFRDTFVPTTSVPLPAAYAYNSSTALANRLVSEISEAIEVASSTKDLVSLYLGPLDQLEPASALIVYNRLSTSITVNQQLLGLAGRLRLGDTTALAASVARVSSFSQYPSESSMLFLSLRSSFRSTGASAVELLGQIATNSTLPSSGFRQAAAHALASVHIKESLPFLVALLDDTDPTLRAEGVGGIGSFANGLPVQTDATTSALGHLQLPASAPYMTEDTIANFAQGVATVAAKESAYISFWKGWWTQNRAQLGY